MGGSTWGADERADCQLPDELNGGKMENQVVVRQGNQVADWTQDADKVGLLKRAFMDKETSDDELKIAVITCSRTGLDPFARQIYFVRRKGKMVSQTSIDGFRLIADRTGNYGGQDDALFDEGLNLYQHLETKRGNPKTATVTVYKVIGGVRCAYTASANWEQYYPGELQGFMWKKMPHLMLAKCCEALALRKAFPAELSGLYTDTEMAQADKGGRVSFEDQMASERERLAKKELAKVGVIDAESNPVGTSTLPEKEKSQGEALEGTEDGVIAWDKLKALTVNQQQDFIIKSALAISDSDGNKAEELFISWGSFPSKKPEDKGKLIPGKKNPYDYRAGKWFDVVLQKAHHAYKEFKGVK